MAGTLRAAARLAAWTAGLVVTSRLLYSLGTDDIRMPLTSFADLERWLADTPPPTMAIAVIRLAALAGVTYLLAATALAVAANLIRARPLEAAAHHLTPALVRRVAKGGGGVGLALGAALGSVPTPHLTPRPIIATGPLDSLTPDPDPNSDSPGSDPPGSYSPDVATMTRHDPGTATMTRTPDPPAPTTVGTSARSGPEETGATPGPDAPSPGPTSPTNPTPPPNDPAAPTPATTPDPTPADAGPGPAHAANPTPADAGPGPAHAANTTAPDAGPGPAHAADPGSNPTAATSPPGPAGDRTARSPAAGDRHSTPPAATDAAPNPTDPDGRSDPAVAADSASLATALRRVGRAADTPGPSPPTGPTELPPLTATMVRIDGSPIPAVGSGASPLPQAGNTWVVEPGDSFWSIAEDVLASTGGAGGPPAERDVGRYWRRLIDANRDRLVDPGNPDLLLPGQELVLPP